jgi:hypothetical protein
MLGLLIALGTATDPGLERVIRIRNEAGRTNRPPCRKSALEKSQELPIAKMGALNSGSNGVTRGRQSKRTSIPPDVPLGQRSMKGQPGLGAFPRDRRYGPDGRIRRRAARPYSSTSPTGSSSLCSPTPTSPRVDWSTSADGLLVGYGRLQAAPTAPRLSWCDHLQAVGSRPSAASAAWPRSPRVDAEFPPGTAVQSPSQGLLRLSPPRTSPVP